MVVDTSVSLPVQELTVSAPVMRTLLSITTPGLVLLEPPDLLGNQDQRVTIATLLYTGLVSFLLLTLKATSFLRWHVIVTLVKLTSGGQTTLNYELFLCLKSECINKEILNDFCRDCLRSRRNILE